jgi:dolichol-phosphate mannosyltransferase
VQQGLAAATAAWTVVMDGDLQHPPERVPDLIAAAERGADVVVATRYAGVATVVFIAAFGAAGGHGGLAGLWERAAGAATSALTVAVLARLAVLSRRAARARRPGPAGGEVA